MKDLLKDLHGEELVAGAAVTIVLAGWLVDDRKSLTNQLTATTTAAPPSTTAPPTPPPLQTPPPPTPTQHQGMILSADRGYVRQPFWIVLATLRAGFVLIADPDFSTTGHPFIGASSKISKTAKHKPQFLVPDDRLLGQALQWWGRTAPRALMCTLRGCARSARMGTSSRAFAPFTLNPPFRRCTWRSRKRGSGRFVTYLLINYLVLAISLARLRRIQNCCCCCCGRRRRRRQQRQ